MLPIYIGNISGGNQRLRVNYGNFNRGHPMLIQGKTHERWEGWCAKLMRGGRHDLQRHFCKSSLPPPMSPPLDQHRVTQIKVSIVCTEGLVPPYTFPYIYISFLRIGSTLYVSIYIYIPFLRIFLIASLFICPLCILTSEISQTSLNIHP
jgi:hypothetical protein